MTPAAADILEDIVSRRSVVVGTEAGHAPFVFVKDGEIVGYHADLFDLVMADLRARGVQVTHPDVPFRALLAGLQGKKFDAVVTALFAT